MQESQKRMFLKFLEPPVTAAKMPPVVQEATQTIAVMIGRGLAQPRVRLFKFGFYV